MLLLRMLKTISISRTVMGTKSHILTLEFSVVVIVTLELTIVIIVTLEFSMVIDYHSD